MRFWTTACFPRAIRRQTLTDEYISREAAIEEIDKWLDTVGTALVGKGLSYYGELIGCIEDAPAADVTSVVRCKDCKYGDYDSKPNGAMVCLRTNDGSWRKETDFCSYGERREE